MAEPFKNLLNPTVIAGIAGHLDKHANNFDKPAFIKDANHGLERLELKARGDQITNTMVKHLPTDFNEAGRILLATLGTPLAEKISGNEIDDNGIAGWAITPMAHYVALHGHDNFELSMTLLKAMTKRATSEFAIRYFLINSPEQTLAVLQHWALDEDHHVRRLASEGSRPRLPWGMQLPMFVKDPTPLLPLLEQLKDDPSEYVRRSVANNLNDIAKDHPDLVADIAKKWLPNTSKNRERLIRHACRTLIKNGHQKTLSTLGYEAPIIKDTTLALVNTEVTLGNSLDFSFSLTSTAQQSQPLIIDFVIHHQKANGTTSPKVFKWKTVDLAANKTLTITKKHPIKKVTTRQYYAGLHHLEVMINGVPMGKVDFSLFI